MPFFNICDNCFWFAKQLTKQHGKLSFWFTKNQFAVRIRKSTPPGRLREIAVSPGCDAQLGRAIHVFSWKLAPYSADSRRYSIFWLVRKLIDPEWENLQARHPDLSVQKMDFAWANVQRERQLFNPCSGKIKGRYVLSEIARRYGFEVFGRFIQHIAKKCADGTDSPHLACFDALIELAFVCQAKLSERKKTNTKDARETLNVRRAHLRPTCRFCGQMTEFSLHIQGAPLAPGYLKTPSRYRLSAMYCQSHKPKDPLVKRVPKKESENKKESSSVRSAYLKAKRSASKFDLELERLEHQILGGPREKWAKSGNEMVDEFIQTLVRLKLQETSFVDPSLRDVARLLVDMKISDKKKELVMYVSHGLNQTEAAKRLRMSRQAVSKLLKSIHRDFRFDRLLMS